MPIYEYRCQSCGHHLEALQKVDEGVLRKCPGCGALKLKRLVSAPNFHLKGTGWYATDFKKSANKDDKKEGAEGGKEGKDGATDKPASDAKTDKSKSEKSDKAEKAEKTDKTPATKSDTGKTGASAD
jgi:putative FmdB family regulatory protein